MTKFFKRTYEDNAADPEENVNADASDAEADAQASEENIVEENIAEEKNISEGRRRLI